MNPEVKLVIYCQPSVCCEMTVFGVFMFAIAQIVDRFEAAFLFVLKHAKAPDNSFLSRLASRH